MRVLHSSDLHGKVRKLILNLANEKYDLWIDTGDFFPNISRGKPHIEVPYQTGWAERDGLVEILLEALNGRPLISIPGNHDYISLADTLKAAGGNAHTVVPQGINVAGYTWAGFRHIPWIAGEWQGETHNFSQLITRVLEAKPDLLITHAPPAGILDGPGYGIPGLTAKLMYENHNIKAHFFGHEHSAGGYKDIKSDILFANGARTNKIHII